MFLTLSAYPQKEPGRISKFDALLSTEIAVNEGSIIMNDGSQLKGLVGYNEKSGILKFEGGKGSKLLTARQVISFEVFDPGFNGVRNFYVFQREDPQNGAMGPHFFELLGDFGSFAVLSAHDPLKILKSTTTTTNEPDNSLNTSLPDNSVEQVETIYLLKPGENPEAYFSLIIRSKERKPWFSDGVRSKKKYKDKDLLEDYMGELFPKVRAYAKENELSLKEKSDFLKILEYYQTLTN